MKESTVRVGKLIAAFAAEIEKFFVDGVFVTIIVRNPHTKNGELIVTKDDVQEVIRALANGANQNEIDLREIKHDA